MLGGGSSKGRCGPEGKSELRAQSDEQASKRSILLMGIEGNGLRA